MDKKQKITGGYILTSRKMLESEIWSKPPLYFKVWMYLLMRAQFKDYKNLKRGQVVVSIPEIIEACSWKVGYRTEKPTRAQIFNILEWLRRTDEATHEETTNETMIDTTKTTRGLVVTISNYGLYQDPKNYEHNDEDNNEESTKTTMPQRQADTINKNDKNVKKDKNDKELKDNVADAPSISSEELFEEWWNLYGNKKGRAKCVTKYKSLLKKYSHEKMMFGTQKYIDHRKELIARKEFCPQQKNPLTFLNGEHFNDEYGNAGGGNFGRNETNRRNTEPDDAVQSEINATNERRKRLLGIESD